MLYIWQHIPQYINPIAFNIGPIQIAWYGIMYLVAFAVVYYFVRYRIQRDNLGISLETVQDFFPWAIVGLLLGARLGDVFIYDWSYFQNHLSQIFLPFDIHNNWQYIGIYGMSYFGGLVGLIITFVIFSFLRFGLKKRSIAKILEFSDLFAPAVPLGFTFGRLGNFANGELWGRVTNKFWGMYFPADFSGQLRHPSQLYEAFLEGILLFAVLWSIRKIKFPTGYLTALYLIGYGLARFTAEFFREPDNGWIFWQLTFGQWLSVFLFITGTSLLFRRKSSSFRLPLH
ncbi:MAG: prolipoprotein diacylglyceryl transferase [Candidatus Moranbacteria bacterium RIFOXYB1_FULL_44_23]|nr:MAG: prolipoprotein diacylglyceryl transferase [Candidatus Moranbacteria bacterium RIFOXYA1_FULL_44_8]OGI34573.1 MAG: prolipoprotein diacylglyceryl transferase [Candidatus Moranbacteria bacterium RIFOXYC1_FULL_44_8]OGI40322.1 MAG: prolipoprotein diacylglyceryl transferase [Candidatus Moranbacteria bacterium RIFOXYB1_FULL_44_23]OGI43317.1 MAG: prolipoprotein diacylglyceryl transferase [Candidatus Moranbacteria bacterium RIFOXYD1_FULL_44_9]